MGKGISSLNWSDVRLQYKMNGKDFSKVTYLQTFRNCILYKSWNILLYVSYRRLIFASFSSEKWCFGFEILISARKFSLIYLCNKWGCIHCFISHMTDLFDDGYIEFIKKFKIVPRKILLLHEHSLYVIHIRLQSTTFLPNWIYKRKS